MIESTNLQNDNLFLSVEDAAILLQSTPKTLYTYLCNSGSQGGKKRKVFPSEIYVKMGRKVLFIKQKLIDWVIAGAEFM